ncbi:MAG: hypothetical protein H6765_00970 [Candidatus Peribacteria bacterium]|nr:MAG: hypothetical protein H6765_00970 [Candidatus Peribacteria bacterium]
MQWPRCDTDGDGTYQWADYYRLDNAMSSYDVNYLEVLDYNWDFSVDQADLAVLSSVADGASLCPQNRICDINLDTYVNAADEALMEAMITDFY